MKVRDVTVNDCLSDITASNEEQIRCFSHSYGLRDIEELFYFPKFIQIETVALCNARCIMCTVKEWKRESNYMSHALFNKIVNEISSFSDWVERVTIQLDGEPLLDKKLEGRIKTLKGIGVKYVAFSSNASLMNEDRAKSILLSGVDEVSFSIDGATAETFERIRKGLTFHDCIENIQRFVYLRDLLKPDLTIRIRMTIQKENISEFDLFLSFWKGMLSPHDYVYGKLLHHWTTRQDSYSPPVDQDKERLNVTSCTSLWSSFVILTDGRVPLCCSDFNAKIQFGNVMNSSIQEIWQNARFEKTRNLHRLKGRQSIKLCKDCNVWDDSSKFYGLRQHKGKEEKTEPFENVVSS